MKRIVLELDDDTVTSIEAHLSVQIRQGTDELTGANTLKRVEGYETVETFVQGAVHQLCETLSRQYPCGKVREHMMAEAAAKKAVKDASKPRLVG